MSRTVVQNGLSLGFALMIAGSVLVAPSPAAWIHIDNHSFEETPSSLADGTSSGQLRSNYLPGGIVIDWGLTLNGTFTNPWAFIRNPSETAPSFIDANDNSSTGGVPPGGDGKRHLYLVLQNGTGGWTVSQTLDEVFQAGTYTLSVAVGYPGGRVALDNYSISVLAGSTVLGSYGANGDDVPEAYFQDRSVTFDVLSNSEHLGQPITVALSANTTASSGTYKQMCFDNVRLQFIPEPGTLALLVGGLAGFACRPWRRRRR